MVDARLRSCDPDIYAAGDVANAFHPLLGRHIRVEHWANALNQPQAAAKSMLGRTWPTTGCRTSTPTSTTWGWSTSGTSSPRLRPGRVPRRRRGASSSRSGWPRRVLAGMNVNVWDVTDAIKALVRSGRTVDPGRLADPGVSLDELGGD